jgi:hypothetical protein
MCDCTLDTDTHARLICVEDFDGTCHHEAQFDAEGWPTDAAWSHHTAFWGDYDPETNTTHFGGAWNHVPDLHTQSQPDERTLHAHAGSHCLSREI